MHPFLHSDHPLKSNHPTPSAMSRRLSSVLLFSLAAVASYGEQWLLQMSNTGNALS